MVRLLSFVIAAFIFSCTIIEDGDITSQEELDKLKLVSIDIEQQASGGTSTLKATVTKDIEVNLQPSGVKRQIWMDWPALGTNSKLKVKSGTTAAFKSYTSLLEGGKPYTFYLFTVSGTDTTVLEQYSFRYNSSGRLATVITRVPYVPNALATTNDTLIYDTNGRLSGITRKYPAAGTTAAAFTNISYNSSGSSFHLSLFIFQGMKYAKDCNDPSCGGSWGGNYDVLPTSTGFPTGVMNLTSTQKAYLSIEDFNNLNQNNCGGNPCNAWIDTFYLHPLMIFKDQFTEGNDFLFLYMVDWWKPSTALAPTGNEKVIFTFNYDI